MERHPIIIVGSGPAGTATALALHRRDPALAAEALILEKARHPRFKVCAGGLIPGGVRWMREHGVALSVPHVTVHRARVDTPLGCVEHDDHNLCYIIRRAEFDASLVAACRERDIAVREEEPVLHVERDGDGVRLETPRGAYHARVVVGADGSGSLIRRRLVDASHEEVARAVMADVPVAAARWDGFAAQRYEFDFREVAHGLRGYRWAFPCLIDGVPHANLGIYSVRPCGTGLDDLLTAYLRSMTDAVPRRHAFPIHWYRPGTRVAAPHVLLAGDAAGVDALMGEGISQAMEYGSLAAVAAERALQTGDFSGAAYQQDLERSWLGKKLGRLHLATRLFYGPAWRLWFALPSHSRRVRALGLRWYNGVDEWDRRSGWSALGALITNRVAA